MNRYGQTVCLNMIVRNEAPVIARCLASVRPLIDSWAIVDTGSSDGTQDIVHELLADLPGELIERPWRDFGSNRTEALQLARGRADYLFLIDADEVVELDPDFLLPRLTADAYLVETALGGFTHTRRQLVRDALDWRYEGVLHEYIVCEQAGADAGLRRIRTISYQDGSRSRDPNTSRHDALCLEEALIDEPDNARYVFYLAQSYRDAGDPELALRYYRRRAEMPGQREETWYALYQIGLIEESLERPWSEVLEAYLKAFELVPDRAEALFRVGLHYQGSREHVLSHTFLGRAMQIPAPAADRLFVEQPVYDYLLGIEYAVAAFYVGDHEAAVATNNELLRSGRVPESAVGQVVVNRRFSLDVRHPRHPGATVGRVLVVTTVRDPGPELEGTVAALLEQDDEDFQVVVVDEGSAVPVASRLPGDPRLRVVCIDAPRQPAAVLAENVVGGCAPDDVVVALPPGHSLAVPSALATVRAVFADAGCMLLYGPHAGPDGELGSAHPAASAAEHDARGPDLAAGSALCFRASLHAEAAAGAEAPDRDALWRAAGFARTRFLDDALTAPARPSPRRRPAVAVARVRATNGERQPAISCLMVTRDRLALAKRAIRCFGDQTHPERELVIVSEGDRDYRTALERYIDQQAIEGARVVRAEPGVTLGRLRNMTLDEATGPIVCQWDDDDCSHPNRLAEQWEAMEHEGADACFLIDHLQYLEHERLIFWIDWTMSGALTDEWQLFPGTVMMRRDERFRYPEAGPYSSRGEDSVMVDQLWHAVPVARVAGMGHLYLYHYHGRNTFSREHHLHITSCAGANERIEAMGEKIREALRYYPVPKPIPVLGASGPVFVAG
jgi:glycosyltransferase involved in cell wall biosynthesis